MSVYPHSLCQMLWILTTVPATVTSKITLICPGEATQFIEVRKPIHVLCLPTACSATSPNFHLPPHYESPPLELNILLDMANLNMINILSLNFQVWQHLDKHQNESQLQHLASIPTIPVGQLYSHMATGIQCMLHLFHLQSQQVIQIQSGHCCHIQECI